MTKEEKKIIEILLRKIQMILINDDFIPMTSAKEINENIKIIKTILDKDKDK
jgi:hypothetical protein